MLTFLTHMDHACAPVQAAAPSRGVNGPCWVCSTCPTSSRGQRCSGGLWEDWDVATFMQSTRKPPQAVGTEGSAQCWWVGGRLCRSGVPVPDMVTVGLEAACQGVGTQLRAPYLQRLSQGFRSGSQPLLRGLCSQAACLHFSEPRCSLLGARTCFRMCLSAAADIYLLSISRTGKPFQGSFASFTGFMFFFLVLTTGMDRSRCSTNPACAGCICSLLLDFSSHFISIAFLFPCPASSVSALCLCL